jgi:hypothetical protein
MAKSTKPALTEEEQINNELFAAALAAEQLAAEQAAANVVPVQIGQTGRAYRSFAVPFGGAVAGEPTPQVEQVEQTEQVNAPADGQQEEPQV